VVVDAGNGSGGFFKSLVMEPLGANTTGSQFLEPDGNFPNHVPNPEDAEAMASATAAVLGAKADLGVVFDTDVDRSGASPDPTQPVCVSWGPRRNWGLCSTPLKNATSHQERRPCTPPTGPSTPPCFSLGGVLPQLPVRLTGLACRSSCRHGGLDGAGNQQEPADRAASVHRTEGQPGCYHRYRFGHQPGAQRLHQSQGRQTRTSSAGTTSTLRNGGTTLGDQQARVYHPNPAEERPQLDRDVPVSLVTICRVLPWCVRSYESIGLLMCTAAASLHPAYS
jgi:hypothetical protein